MEMNHFTGTVDDKWEQMSAGPLCSPAGAAERTVHPALGSCAAAHLAHSSASSLQDPPPAEALSKRGDR